VDRLKRRAVPHVLIVTAIEFRDPVALIIKAKALDSAPDTSLITQLGSLETPIT
jgi:hypothetical protein